MVQGNIATGTPLEFYVGGIQAEINDVAKGDSWATSYPYTPGELTELNLRVATQPAVGQTREPTPVQTSASSLSVASSEVTASTGGVSGGSVLPQVPDSQGQQPGAQGTEPSGSTQAGTTEQGGSSPQGGVEQMGGQGSEASPVALPASETMTAYIVGGILVLLVIAGGVYYYTSRKKGEAEKTEEPEKKQE
jgi:cobalamin biosynthesis Mg chelatase CobN